MLRQESYRRGSVNSTVLQIAAQCLAFVFNIVMAACFGAIVATDVLNYCLTTFAIVSGFMLTLDTAVLIPEAMRRRHQESPESSMQFLNFFLFLFLTVAFAISVLAMWNPVRLLTAISKFDIVVLEAHREIILWVIPVFAMQLLAQYTTSILVSYKFFSLPALWGVIVRVLNIVYVLCFYRTLGVVALAQSLIFGLLLQICVAFWLMRRHLGWQFSLRRPRIQMSVWRNIAYTEVGIFVVAITVFSPTLMASAAQEGFVTAMNYALKLVQIPEYLLSSQIALIVGIKLNEFMSKREEETFGRFYERIAGFMFWCCTPIACYLYLVAADILRILLLRGAYTEGALHITTVLFRGLIMALPITIYNALLLQALAAQQKVLLRNIMDIVMSLVIFAGLWLLVPHIGLLNFPWIRIGCLYGVHFLWMLATRQRITNVRLGLVYGKMVLNIAINVSILFICLFILQFVLGWSVWLRLFAMAAVYIVVWGGIQIFWKWDRSALDYAHSLVASGVKHIFGGGRRGDYQTP